MWVAYVTGGGAFQNIDAIATCPGDLFVCNPNTGTQSKKSSEIQVGWTVGGGLEGMVGPNWLARIEYRYSDLGNFSFTALQFNINAHGADAHLSTTRHIVNVGLAYKW